MGITSSNMWKRYSDEIRTTLKKADPTITDDEIDRQLERIARNVTIPIVMRETTHDDIPDVKETLYQAIDDLEASNDIISGSGVIVAQHDEDLSPFVNMFISWKKERSAVKKKMYAAMDAGDNDKARYYNKLQKNLKSNKMNALYGILALVSSAFFHEYVPVAVTASARQLISHSAMMFEAVLGANHKFISIGECVNWINTVIKAHETDTVDSFITYPSSQQVYDRIVESFVNWPGDEHNFLKKYIENIDRKYLPFLYYTNNMVQFISDYKETRTLVKAIFDRLPKDLTLMNPDEKLWAKYGKGEMNSSTWRKMLGKNLFLDPYSPPDTIAAPLAKLREYFLKYCYVSYLPMSPVARLNKLGRKSVCVVDTDSNMVFAEKFTKLALEICDKTDTGIRDKKMNSVTSMMIVANLVDPCIKDMIATFSRARRVTPEYYPNMVMKNEWYYSRMLISPVKKRYAANAMIQEGLYLPKLTIDIKGFDFRKSNIPKVIGDKMVDILINRILIADDIDVAALVDDINGLEAEIKASIKAGKTEYWRTSTFKDESAYKYPDRIQVYKGGTLWNMLYPEQKMESLDKACIGKLKKGAIIKDTLCENVIAVPMTLPIVPPEIVSQLDIDLMAYNIISAFNSVLDCFEIDTKKEKTSSGGKILKRSVVAV